MEKTTGNRFVEFLENLPHDNPLRKYEKKFFCPAQRDSKGDVTTVCDGKLMCSRMCSVKIKYADLKQFHADWLRSLIKKDWL